MRIDVYLVENQLAPSRTRARELIEQGRVVKIDQFDRIVFKKASQLVDLKNDERIEVTPDSELDRFVSRGGFKLLGALQRTRLEVHDAVVLDVGISTGGFSDCLLQCGARRIVGVDVGHGQLAEKLRADSRVTLYEGVNARDLTKVDLIEASDHEGFDLIVMDISFISQTLVLPGLLQYLKEGDGKVPSRILSLVKPQFEVGKQGLGKNGIVKDPTLYLGVQEKMRQACQDSGLVMEDYFESTIQGSDGNKEFFFLAKRDGHSLRRGGAGD